MLEGAAGAGGVGIVMLVTYLKVVASRLDKVDANVERVVDKLDLLGNKVTDHEVRIQVLERLEERIRREEQL